MKKISLSHSHNGVNLCPSRRPQAKILGTSHTNLSRMTNGVRPWNAGLKERYEELGGTTLGTTYRNVTGSGGGGRSRPAFAQECEPAGIRTQDTRIKSPMLCQTELPAHDYLSNSRNCIGVRRSLSIDKIGYIYLP